MIEQGAEGGVTTVLRSMVEYAATGIEGLAVAIVVFGTVVATFKLLWRPAGAVGDAYRRFRIALAKALTGALELLVAADIIRTVVLDETMMNVLRLAVLVVVRTFLGWTLVVEVEGRWPWSSANAEGAARVAASREEPRTERPSAGEK